MNIEMQSYKDALKSSYNEKIILEQKIEDYKQKESSLQSEN